MSYQIPDRFRRIRDNVPFAVLCDFDGTISKADVGSTLFRTYAGGPEWEELIEAWKRGDIGSRDCLVSECRMTRVSREEVVSLAGGFEIDEHFPGFVSWCEENRIPLAVVSDGLDFYIRQFLKKFGLARLPVYANRLRFIDGGIEPEFPYFEHGCGSCGNCKGYHVLEYKRLFGRVVFVGDGYSDRCALEDADLVLAKKGLAALCKSLRAPCVEVDDFRDVRERLQEELA
ncbi:MAG: MtnX-like HAD-IB family phosphatase [Candidatus Eiseniibacteriota bacterium]|nr:MAG: MtnX-like HAD-IB family phosphatase [Candidatus Eisenbacteria bacterium]